ncbi:MAG TPA: tRNA lysidine(34) synthetase TilS, partial [Nevskiaceae bacterium]|nr:tRNA lysidine(34) synthetase TilS [Nevskiaceae bacterium]
DDQAETVLLRLLRGSGPRGLGGMRAMRAFPPGRLWRPLLAHSRDALRRHAAALSPLPVDDPHNSDPRYARSYLRQALMPLVAARWPGVTGNLARAAALEQEAASLLDALADEDLARLPVSAAPDAATLPIAALRSLDPVRRRNLVRRWIESKGLPVPYRDTLLRLEAEVLDVRPEGEPCLAWPGAELRRYRDALVAMPTLPPPPRDVALGWDGEGLLTLPEGCGRLEGERLGACIVHVPAPAGTRFQPPGAAHHRTCKNLFQERGVPPWVRERTPALERGGRIAWIGGIGWAEGETPGAIDWVTEP